MQEVVN